jgi:thymidylate kinase
MGAPVLRMLTRSQVISKLFHCLEENGINYVVVGDTRGYPEEIHGDTDIVTDPHSLPLAHQTLFKFCRDHSIKIVQILQHEQLAWYYVLAWFDKTGKLLTLNPDICSDYIRFGKLFLTSEEVLDGRVRVVADETGSLKFFVPSPPKGFVYYLLKKIDKGSLDQRQGNYLFSQWNSDIQGGMAQITRFWPDPDANILANAAYTNNWTQVRKEIGKFKSLLRKSLRFSATHWCRELVRKVRRLFNPTGLMVVFLGSDGSGKSTIITQVQSDLAPLFRRTKAYHFRPHFGRRMEDHPPVAYPHDQAPRNIIASCLKLLLYFVDYSIGYCYAILPRKIRSTLILFDRYFFDVIVDPRRLRYGGPRWIPVFLAKCIPAPDLVFYLDAPPAVLLSRKQEISASEIERQRHTYLDLTHNLPNAHKIDVSKPLPEVIDSVERIIVEFLESRVLKRLPSGLTI